jgi:hypothetical protein
LPNLLSERLEWLKENLKYKIGHLDNIALYVWFGTCDPTAYDKQTRFISIKDQTNETIQKVVNNYQEIAENMYYSLVQHVTIK